MNVVVVLILLAFSIFQLLTGYFGAYTAYIQRTVHLGFALVLIFLLFPATKKAPRRHIAWYDYGLAALAIIICGYWPVFYESLVKMVGSIDLPQMIIGGIAVLLVLEASRRVVGLPLVIIASVFMLYAIFGPYMPGMLAHRGLNLNQLIKSMFFTTEGILVPRYKCHLPLFSYLLFSEHF